MQLSERTPLALVVAEGGKPVEYGVVVAGQSRYGVVTSLPHILDQAVAMPAGTKLLAYFPVGGGVAEFDTYVMGYVDSPPRMVIAEPTQFRRRERRGSVRFRTQVPVAFAATGPRALGDKTKTMDLSIGGLCMITSQMLNVGTPMTLFVTLPQGPIDLNGRVVWSGYRGINKVAGVHFENMPERIQTSLAYHLFGLERQLREGKAT